MTLVYPLLSTRFSWLLTLLSHSNILHIFSAAITRVSIHFWRVFSPKQVLVGAAMYLIIAHRGSHWIRIKCVFILFSFLTLLCIPFDSFSIVRQSFAEPLSANALYLSPARLPSHIFVSLISPSSYLGRHLNLTAAALATLPIPHERP